MFGKKKRELERLKTTSIALGLYPEDTQPQTTQQQTTQPQTTQKTKSIFKSFVNFLIR